MFNKLDLMGSFNLKHSNRLFFFFFKSQTVQYFCQLTRKTWTECCFYMQNIHLVFFCVFFVFFSISTLYTRRHRLKKRKRLVQIQSTTTGREVDTFLQCYIQFVQPTPEIWMLSGLPKQNRPLFTVEQC